MIILDTNIISELMKQSPDQHVIIWLDQQRAMSLFITSITIAEISYGLHALPAGKRQNDLNNSFTNVLNDGFKHRVLNFDERAALVYGQYMAHRKTLGRPLNILDGQIAAIAKENNMSLATRNTNDFLHCDIILINPFHA